jgi:hypothetical protein
MQDLIVGTRSAAGRAHALEIGNILGHRHGFGAGHLDDHGIGFLMVAMCMAADNNLDVREFQTQLGHRVLNNGNIRLVSRVDENVTVRSIHDEGRETFGTDVIELPMMRCGGTVCALLLAGADVASKEFGHSPDMGRLLRQKNPRKQEKGKQQFCPHNGDKSTNVNVILQFCCRRGL